METKQNLPVAVKTQLPHLADIYDLENLEIAYKHDLFNTIVNIEPKTDWIKENKFANNSKYIPIGIIETLLQKFLKHYDVEILREGVMFNAVYVTVRLHYTHPATNEKAFLDGVGAMELQTKSGASPAEMDKINKGAVMMALPAAESYAIKDAAEKLGKLFGRDMNRKDTMAFAPDSKISEAFTTSNEEKLNGTGTN